MRIILIFLYNKLLTHRNIQNDGCITLPSHADYAMILLDTLLPPSVMVTAQLKAFGTIQAYR
ncbi:hypothetical protein FCH31_10815 [Lelliottia amnigena]|nr:hypothetical protein [Lelliottia amnigena]